MRSSQHTNHPRPACPTAVALRVPLLFEQRVAQVVGNLPRLFRMRPSCEQEARQQATSLLLLLLLPPAMVQGGV